jgi:serine/threonine protein kinase
MKSKPFPENVAESQLENKIENLMNLRHPCITAPIGFVFRIESGSRRELKIVRLYLEGCSLSEVLSVNPIWWTSAVKAKTVAGIVLALRFAHSLGLIHGHLTGTNILFDSNIVFKSSIFGLFSWKLLTVKVKVKTGRNLLACQVKDGQ